MDNTELENKILEILRSGNKTSDEIRKELLNMNIDFNPIQFREVLAELVRQGKIKKIPDYSKKKFLFSI
ncbi:hypothetical protein DFR86_07710 [Acidianus sulfidivorans JP7]|uniref:Uncharacterized protein n=1 Tax=Acidianus sulfidivorans JP7 TaxID=619593 RepID=A0A2U9INB6_9CREN|nr:hypothetical protein [Acidianus sulfidivorans]AWR97444.1 hypothetical protein DFR86_07710 [Acidianus sulfidivorans JP7]